MRYREMGNRRENECEFGGNQQQNQMNVWSEEREKPKQAKTSKQGGNGKLSQRQV